MNKKIIYAFLIFFGLAMGWNGFADNNEQRITEEELFDIADPDSFETKFTSEGFKLNFKVRSGDLFALMAKKQNEERLRKETKICLIASAVVGAACLVIYFFRNKK